MNRERDSLLQDCVELDNLNPDWGARTSIRQSRKELIQLLEVSPRITTPMTTLSQLLNSRCDKLLQSDLPRRVEMLPKVKSAPAPQRSTRTYANGAISAPPVSFASRSSQSTPQKKESRFDVFPPKGSNWSDAPPRRVPNEAKDKKKRNKPAHGEFFESESDNDDKRKRHTAKRPPVDWNVKLKEKIHTLKVSRVMQILFDEYVADGDISRWMCHFLV